MFRNWSRKGDVSTGLVLKVAVAVILIILAILLIWKFTRGSGSVVDNNIKTLIP
jgi:hypothetical protein